MTPPPRPARPGRRWRWLGLVGAVVVVLGASPLAGQPAHAQLLPDPPSIAEPPDELQPLLELLGPAGTEFLSGPCLSSGLALTLGLIAVPSLPNTVGELLGTELPALPIDLSPELDEASRFILALHAAGCGLFPRPGEHTVCDVDDQIIEYATPPPAIQALFEQAVMDIVAAEIIPPPPAMVGAVVATVGQAAAAGVPGAAEVYAALAELLGCELRAPEDYVGEDFVVAEPAPAAPASSGVPPTAGPLPEVADRALLPSPAPAVTETAPRPAPVVSVAEPATITTTRVVGVGDGDRSWLVVLAVVAFTVFGRRALAPRRSV